MTTVDVQRMPTLPIPLDIFDLTFLSKVGFFTLRLGTIIFKSLLRTWAGLISHYRKSPLGPWSIHRAYFKPPLGSSSGDISRLLYTDYL